jgi:hypothetical protein
MGSTVTDAMTTETDEMEQEDLAMPARDLARHLSRSLDDRPGSDRSPVVRWHRDDPLDEPQLGWSEQGVRLRWQDGSEPVAVLQRVLTQPGQRWSPGGTATSWTGIVREQVLGDGVLAEDDPAYRGHGGLTGWLEHLDDRDDPPAADDLRTALEAAADWNARDGLRRRDEDGGVRVHLPAGSPLQGSPSDPLRQQSREVTLTVEGDLTEAIRGELEVRVPRAVEAALRRRDD